VNVQGTFGEHSVNIQGACAVLGHYLCSVHNWLRWHTPSFFVILHPNPNHHYW
jgi:hypothetical protein